MPYGAADVEERSGMTAKTAAQILAETAALYPDNSVGFITPANLRAVTNDIINSIMPTAPVVGNDVPIFDGTTGLFKDSGLAVPLSAFVGVSDTQALTNKTINGNTFTSGTYTLTGAAGKTFTFSNTLTLVGTDATTLTFPATSATIARTDAGQTFTGTNAFGVITVTTVNGNSFPTGTYTLSGNAGKTLAFLNSLTLAGTDGTVMTFPGTSATIARTDAGNAFTGNQSATGSILSSSASGGVGYTTGSGGAVTQITSRATGVTLNTTTGAITLLTAAGSATPIQFTVTNSSVAATDIVHVCVKSATNLYETFVTGVAGGSFNITFFTTGGTASDSPVFNFAVIKGAIS